MKNKFLLTLIPAFMVLSGCNPLSNYAAAGTKVNQFAEDTLVHEEIFGESEIELQSFKNNPLRAPGLVAPVYAVQYQEDGENVHMRLIAAVYLPNLSAEVEWTRTMYKGHLSGEQSSQSGHVFKEEANKACTKAYTSLANGTQDPLTIADINSQYGSGDDYNYFVVYTMLNIPKEGYSDYSIKANVSIGPMSFTKTIAATVGQNAVAIFNSDMKGHFISGRFDGNHDEWSPVYDEDHKQNDNNAVYYDVDLKVGDTFTLVYYDDVNNVFLLNGKNRDGDKGYFCDNSKNTLTSKYEGKFTIYLNNSDMVYLLANSKLTRKLYVDVSELTWWGETYGRKTALYRFGGSEPADFVVMSKVAGNENLYVTSEDIDPDEYSKFIVLDYKGSNPSSLNWDTDLENKSEDSVAISNNSKDCLKLKNEKSGNNWKVEWVTR